MKKLLLLTAAFASMLFASCQKEEINPSAGNASVTFSVEVPTEAQTRAGVVENGENINDLVFAVYKTSSNNLEDAVANMSSNKLVYQKNPESSYFDANGKTNVTIELVNDQNYVVLFWAQVKDAWVKGTDFDLTNITYPASMNCNDSNLAAFSGVTFIEKVDGSVSKSIKLTRPFAQINIGTTLPKEFDVELTRSYVKVFGVGSTFNVASQEVASNNEYVEFKSALQVGGTLRVNDIDYTYVAMNYIFANGNVDVKYNISTKEHGTVSNTVENVPVMKNYKTNIVGNLLTSNVDYTVELDNNWGTPSNVVELWDGTTLSEPVESTTDENTYVIENPSELAWLAAAVNGTLPETKSTIAPESFAGKTFVLTEDVYLGGHDWTPIGTSANPFKGTFDGQGYTIYDLVVNGGSESNKGLFGFTTEGEIKNVNVHNAKVSGRLNVGVVAGQPYTSKYTDINVTGHVEVNGMAYVGGVGGKNAYADWTNVKVEVDETSFVKANSVENGTAYRTYVGGVVGFNGEGGHKFSNITSNINVKGSTCDVGGLFGIAHYGNQFENCVCTGNVEIYAAEEADEVQEMGGIAGVWNNETGYQVTFDNCSFSGELKANIEGVDFYYGGLIGKPYSATGKGKLIINGKQYVSTASELQSALDAATEGETTIFIGADIVGDVTEIQKPGRNVTIDGCDNKYNGTIKIHSNSYYYADAALTIKNVNFETSSASINVIEALENGSERYSSNITVEECTFTASGAAVNTSVGVQVKATRGVTVKNCTATNMHSLIQAQSCDTGDIKVVGCTVNGKNGVAFKQVKSATVEGTTITALEYGIRFDGNIDNYGIIVTNNNVTAVQPFIVRKMTGNNNTINLVGSNVLTPSIADDYQIVITKGSDDEVYVVPTGTYTLSGAENFDVYPNPELEKVKTADGLVSALEAGKNVRLLNDIKIEPAKMSNAYGKTGINVKLGQSIDGGGKTLNIKGAGGTWDSGINTTGGLIKDITVTGSFRGIFVNHTSDHSEKVILNNVTIGGNGTVYTISCDQGLNQGLEATNSTFNGWTSYAATIGDVKFTNCNFGAGGGYKYCRPYAPTEFVNCNFCEGYTVNPRADVSFENCTLNGVAITLENISTLVTSTEKVTIK